MQHEKTIKELLSEVLVYDIETSSFNKEGKRINLRSNFDEYVKYAKVKWFGAYSYKYKRYFEFDAIKDKDSIKTLLEKHEFLVGFNNKNFDGPILKNNGYFGDTYKKELDVMLILGDDQYRPGFKKRATYMKVKLKPCTINGKKYGTNSLQGMATAFGIELPKGDIDYKLFDKNTWSDEEQKDIIKYLRADVEITKQLFDKIINFWSLFTDWLHEDDVRSFVWINSTIAVLTYYAVCRVKGVEPTFSNLEQEKEEMGGRAVKPTDEEVFGAHYMDETSKYPHIFAEFNLFKEVNIHGQPQEKIDKLIEKGYLFHGNEKFKVKGYYDIRSQGVIEKDLINKLKTRFAIKKVLKNYYKNKESKIVVPEILKDQIPNGELTNDILQKLDGQEFAIKIFANSLYGIIRKITFEKVSTPSAGYDCCWIGQQIHEYVQTFFEERGFKVIGGFTDSWFVEDKNVSEEEIMKLARECMDDLKKYMPFPEETHQIGYECYIDTIIYSYDDKRGEYKKNNYAYISDNKIKIVGFPIKKSNASKLALHIFNNFLKNEALKNKKLKFEKSYVKTLIKQELEKDISLAATTFKCNNADNYAVDGQLQRQISINYLGGLDGEIDVIKNKKIGKVGKGYKYCTIKEAIENNLKFDDLVLTKVWNELEPFLIKVKKMDLNDFIKQTPKNIFC